MSSPSYCTQDQITLHHLWALHLTVHRIKSHFTTCELSILLYTGSNHTSPPVSSPSYCTQDQITLHHLWALDLTVHRIKSHFTTCELSILLYIGSNHTSQLQSIQDRKLEVLTGWISGSHEHRRAVPGAEVTAVGDGPMLHWPQPASDGSFLPLGGRQRWGVLPGCWLQTPCPRGFEGPVRWRDKCKTDHTDSSS